MKMVVEKQINFAAEVLIEEPEANNTNSSWLSFCVLTVKKY